MSSLEDFRALPGFAAQHSESPREDVHLPTLPGEPERVWSLEAFCGVGSIGFRA